MPNDIQDWTAAVNVQAGTVTIGSGTVSISGTPTVNINAGQSVAISGTPNVVISGTPNVSIAGTPTVILGGGTASIGSISAIGSTVTVAGTINIGNTPAVTISGTPSVTISSGTVAISGTPSINIQSQAVNLNVQQAQQFLGDAVGTGALNATTFTLPEGTQGIMLLLNGLPSVNYVQLSVRGIPSFGGAYGIWSRFALGPGNPSMYFVPFPSGLFPQIEVDLNAAAGWNVRVAAVIQAAPELHDFFPQPGDVPNQLPTSFGGVVMANGAVQALIAPIANQVVNLFEARIFLAGGAGVAYDLEDDLGNVFWNGITGDSPPSFHGVAFAPGRGIRWRNQSGAAQTMGGSAIYSRS